MQRGWRRWSSCLTLVRDGGCVSTEPGSGSRDCGRSRSGFPTTGPQGSPRRPTARRVPLPPVSAPTKTRRSWTRSRSGPTSEMRRDLDRRWRRRLHRQASTSGDRPRRPLRHRLGHHLPFHHRPHRGAAVPAVHPGVSRQRTARSVPAHGRQAHHGASIQTWRASRGTRRCRCRPPQPGHGRLPRHLSIEWLDPCSSGSEGRYSQGSSKRCRIRARAVVDRPAQDGTLGLLPFPWVP